MKYFILAAILVLVCLLGCQSVDVSKLSDKDLERLSDKAVVCNAPYIRFGMTCCLDQDSNSICDKDEENKTTTVKDNSPPAATATPAAPLAPVQTAPVAQANTPDVQPVVTPSAPQTLSLPKTATLDSALVVSDYPKMFMTNSGAVELTIVVGDTAPGEDVVAAIDIATSLQYAAKTQEVGTNGVVQVGTAKLASEIKDVTQQNVLLIGSACSNLVLNTFVSDCASLSAGEGIISIQKMKTGKVAIIVHGDSALSTHRAARALADMGSYDFDYQTVKVTGTTLSDINVAPINGKPTPKPGVTLADYPGIFLTNNGGLDLVLSVGDTADGEDVVSAIDIATGLQYYSKTAADGTADDGTTKIVPVQVGTLKLASEIKDINAQNVLLIGTGCTNSLINGQIDDCNSLPDDSSTIAIKKTKNGKYAIIIHGGSTLATHRAARALADMGSYNFNYPAVKVTGTTLTDISVSPMS